MKTRLDGRIGHQLPVLALLAAPDHHPEGHDRQPGEPWPTWAVAHDAKMHRVSVCRSVLKPPEAQH